MLCSFNFSILQGYRVAYIVFKKAASVQKAKALPYNKPLVMQWKDGPKIKSGAESK